MKKLFFLLCITIACVMPYAQKAESNSLSIQPEDEFLSALLHASEENIGSDKSDISDFIQPAKKEVVQETSLVKKYALIAAVKMIVYYGCCKKCITQCIDYLTAYVWGE